MAISYRTVTRKVMAGEEKGMTKVYGVPVRSKFITFRMLCKRIMIQSSATRGDVSLILQNFMDSVIEYLETGHSVQMDGMGTFHICAGSPCRV
ncbi:MAG: HU family DNA-binding protein [Tannerellaceae bacterium]|nr:HU family DNA-binding protein [Tannerellaceae bacterium]